MSKLLSYMENEYVPSDYLRGRDKIVGKYSFRRGLVSTISTILSAGSLVYPIIETVQSKGTSYSPEEIIAIGSIVTAANILACSRFNKASKKKERKELHRYNIKEDMVIM